MRIRIGKQQAGDQFARQTASWVDRRLGRWGDRGRGGRTAIAGGRAATALQVEGGARRDSNE